MSLQVKAARGMATANARAMPGIGYRGDPGLFGFLGKVAKGVTGFAGNVLPGPFGGISRALSSVLGNKAPSRPARLPMQTTIPFNRPITTFQPPPRFAEPSGFKRGIQQMLPGGRTGFEQVANGAPPSGYRLNKTSYFLNDGTYVPAGTRYVRIRKRNPANPRANSRAIARITSAKKYAATLGRITIRKTC